MKSLLKKKDIEVLRSDSELVLRCGGLERAFTLANGVVKTRSLSLDGREMAAGSDAEQDFYCIGLNRASEASPYVLRDIQARWYKSTVFSGEHAEVTVEMDDTVCATVYRRTYYLFPGIPALGVRTSIKSAVMPCMYWGYRGNLLPEWARSNWKTESCQDNLKLSFEPVHCKAVEFFGRSDFDNHRVEEHLDGERMRGNLLFVEGGEGQGLLYLQEAPPSTERRDYEGHDFRVTDGQVFSCTWGIMPQEVMSERFLDSQRHVLLAYADKKSALRTLKAYLRARFPLDKAKGGAIVVNPWGCGEFPKLVCEEFLKKEFAASARVGANYYQIDDSWQEGKTLAALSTHNHKMTPAFWNISEALNRSFDSIFAVAKEAGVKPGLWLAPSSNCEYVDWEDTVKIIIDMYNTYGIDLFKIDAVLTRTHLAEENLEKLLRTVREKTGGDVMFNLDTTNGQRPGFYQFVEYGNIFLENRYTHGGVGYHPENVLNSLWLLSRYMRAQILQIEVASPALVKDSYYAERYVGRNDLRNYPVEYWAAIALFASPLMWFAPSMMPTELQAAIKKVNDLHKRLWDEIYETEVFPVGQLPDGSAMTGFQAHNAETGHGYLLFFRELGSENGTASIELEYPVAGDLVPLSGEGEAADATLAVSGCTATLTLPTPASFAIWRY